jgi:hypothetical protein
LGALALLGVAAKTLHKNLKTTRLNKFHRSTQGNLDTLNEFLRKAQVNLDTLIDERE